MNENEVREHSMQYLRDVLPIRADVYTITLKVTRAGCRHVALFALRNDDIFGIIPYRLSMAVGKVLNMRVSKDHDAVIVDEMGTDAESLVVHNLSVAMFGNGVELTRRSL